MLKPRCHQHPTTGVLAHSSVEGGIIAERRRNGEDMALGRVLEEDLAVSEAIVLFILAQVDEKLEFGEILGVEELALRVVV